MTLEFGPKSDCSSDFSVEDRDAKTDTINIACGWLHEGVGYKLSREEARQVWEHLGKQFGFSS